MNTKMKLVVYPDTHCNNYRLYCPTLGDDLNGRWATEDAAKKAAKALGAEIVTEDDLVDVDRVTVNGHDCTHLAWWIENCDFECVRKCFAEILYYEASIRKQKAAGSDSGVLNACSMSVAASLVLENLAADLNQYAPSHVWTNYANWKLDRMLENGEKVVECDLGSVELVG